MFFFFEIYRLGEILVDSDENSIYVTAKLLETAQAEGYFHSENGLTLKNPTSEEYADNEELCARRCLTNANCGAYSYCSALDCKLWTDDRFYDDFNPKDENEFDWNRVEKKKDASCTFSRRIVRYKDESHISNTELLNKIQTMIESSNSNERFKDLLVVDNEFNEAKFKASELRINVVPGRHANSDSKLEDEKFDEERNQIKYNDQFTIISSNKAFSHDLVKAKGKDASGNEYLLGSSRGLSLWECELTCINNKNCESMSFCKDTNECVFTLYNATQLNDALQSEITVENHKCATSISKSNNYFCIFFRYRFRFCFFLLNYRKIHCNVS